MKFADLPLTSPKYIGTSYSSAHINWLKDAKGGCEPLATLEQIATQLPIDIVRIAVPWDAVATENGWNFDETEAAISLCAAHKKKVVLCIGVKNLTWPEHHVPDAIYQKYLKGKRVLSEKLDNQFIDLIYQYYAACLDRYGIDTRVSMIQVENEPLEPTGKDATLRIDPLFLKKLMAFTRTKTNKPLILTAGAGLTEPYWTALRIRPKMIETLINLHPNQVGLNIYEKGSFRFRFYTHNFQASERHWELTARLVETIKKAGITPVVTELQFEPWEADPAGMDMQDVAGNRSFSPDSMQAIWEKAQRLGVETIYPWGLDFQVACSSERNRNNAWLQATKELFS
jgi:hypothetical protein